MILGILSDTHDRLARAERAVAALVDDGAEVLLHCGDLTGPDIVQACSALPSYYVFGNNDFDEDALRDAMAATGGVCLEWGGEVTLDGKRVAVTHGDSIREVNRLAAFGFGWNDTTAAQAYTVHDFHPVMTEELVRRGAARSGLTWHFARPPVVDLEFEMDCRRVTTEKVI